MQAKELSELRAQVEQDKTVTSCLRQELDHVNKVFLAPPSPLAAHPCNSLLRLLLDYSLAVLVGACDVSV